MLVNKFLIEKYNYNVFFYLKHPLFYDNMGAGNKTDHHKQDANELYIVYKLQEILEKKDKHITKDSLKKKDDYLKHCDISKIKISSCYTDITDIHAHVIIDNLITNYPESRFDIVCVETEYRNQSKKGDFLIKFSDDKQDKSVSLKCYKNSINRVQVCSGTWNSFLSRFFLNKELNTAPGIYKSKDDESFSSGKYQKRDEFILENYKKGQKIVENFHILDKIFNKKKDLYIKSSKYEKITEEGENKFKKDCEKYGKQATLICKENLKAVKSDKIKKIILDMLGFHNNGEELLFLDKEQMFISLFDKDFKRFIELLNNNDTKINVNTKKQSLIFDFVNNTKSLLEVNIPFTFNKNGTWFLDKKYKNTDNKFYHEKEGIYLSYGDRRPKKSREFATSTNTWINFSKILTQMRSKKL